MVKKIVLLSMLALTITTFSEVNIGGFQMEGNFLKSKTSENEEKIKKKGIMKYI